MKYLLFFSIIFLSKLSAFAQVDTEIVGIIDTMQITYQDYNTRLNAQAETYMHNMGLKSIDEKTLKQLNNEFWNRIVHQYFTAKQTKVFGLYVSNEDLMDQITGQNIHPAVISFFTRPETNEFDQNMLLDFLSNINDYPGIKPIWLDFENEIAREAESDKLQSLLLQSLHSTQLDESAKKIVQYKEKQALKYFVYQYIVEICKGSSVIEDNRDKFY